MDDINEKVASRLKELRSARGLSLEELAVRSKVSRAMLSQIETLKTNPTIAMLWKIARGLEVPFAELLDGSARRQVVVSRAADARYLYSKDRVFRSRPVLSGVPGHAVELYEISLTPQGVEDAEPHPPGTYEQLTVTEGSLALTVGDERTELFAGDAILFRADRPHRYEALGRKGFSGLSLILYGS